MMNLSHLLSRPAPITMRLWSLFHPITPLAGRKSESPGALRRVEDPEVGSSPISKWAEAKEYTSENTLGSNGIRPKTPHFWLGSASKPGLPPPPWDVNLRFAFVASVLIGLEGCGMSNTWRVDLSDVTASIWPDGAIATEYIVAWSTPRRSSAILAQLLVANTRTRVPWIRVSRNYRPQRYLSDRFACRGKNFAVTTEIDGPQGGPVSRYDADIPSW